jgi:DNA-binding protein YbaB
MPGNAELIAELRGQLERIQERRAGHEAMLATLTETRGELATLTATVTSPDGGVTVVAGAGGLVRSVRLADHALRTTATALSELIETTIRRAIAEAARQQTEIIHERLGPDVDPTRILGPQTRFLEPACRRPPAFPEPATPPPHQSPARGGVAGSTGDVTDDTDGPPTILARR